MSATPRAQRVLRPLPAPLPCPSYPQRQGRGLLLPLPCDPSPQTCTSLQQQCRLICPLPPLCSRLGAPGRPSPCCRPRRSPPTPPSGIHGLLPVQDTLLPGAAAPGSGAQQPRTGRMASCLPAISFPPLLCRDALLTWLSLSSWSLQASCCHFCWHCVF
jgi:hypothetical protein